MSAATAPISGRHVIGGRALSDAAEAFESHDPSRWEQIVGTFPKGTPAEAKAAVAAARDAYPMWRRTSRIHRAELFNKLGQLIERDVDQLANLMSREVGKVVTECRAEVIEGLHMVQY
ncbi:MAG TPA: aldehyde dehydrogenase family protein, partial [Gemmataceae bacterium]|nr:aldehyde dehydrogenase family protein [Gemmataceae bacterium]